VSFLFVITSHMEFILVQGRLQPKFFNVDSTSQLYMRMLLNTVSVTLGASSWVRSVKEI